MRWEKCDVCGDRRRIRAMLDTGQITRDIIDQVFRLRRRLVEKRLHRVLHVGVFHVADRWYYTSDGWHIYEVTPTGHTRQHLPYIAWRVCRPEHSVQSAQDLADAPAAILLTLHERLCKSEDC